MFNNDDEKVINRIITSIQILILFGCILIGFGFGYMIGKNKGVSKMKKEALKLGVADYILNPVTGGKEFVWYKIWQQRRQWMEMTDN